MPGQHVCFRGATLTCGINSWGRSLWCTDRKKGGGVGLFLCISSAAATLEEGRKKNKPCFSFPTGGMFLPVSGCPMEIQPGSAVTLVGPWACVTTWCPFTGSFTLKNGPIGLATSTTGASRTTGAHAQTAKYKVSLFPDKSIHSTHYDSYRRASSPPPK